MFKILQFLLLCSLGECKRLLSKKSYWPFFWSVDQGYASLVLEGHLVPSLIKHTLLSLLHNPKDIILKTS